MIVCYEIIFRVVGQGGNINNHIFKSGREGRVKTDFSNQINSAN